MAELQRPTRSWPLESLGFLLVAVVTATLSLSSKEVEFWQIIALALAVIIFGLPHGALDPWIARREGFAQSRWRFGGQYLGLAVLVILVWWLLPVFSLGVFLVISAWHFGQDWAGLVPPWQRLALGLGLLALPAASNPAQVQLIFTTISSPEGTHLAEALGLMAWITTPLMVAIALVLGWRKRWSAALEIIALVVLAWLVPALIYFIVYFCFLHSPRHVRHCLENTAPDLRQNALRSAGWYTLLTLVLALPFGLYLSSIDDMEKALVQLVFVGLAALTVPHMLLMSRTQHRAKQAA